MRMYDIIKCKRDGGELSREEIEFFVNGFTRGSIPDYQASAMAMAIFLKGMSEREIADLTLTMAHSGDVMDLSRINGFKVDKHSTGGVGDKTTIVVGAIVAACGIPVAKMSGRGLGHTGGTIDKLESFPNFRTSLTEEEFYDNVNKIGFAIAGQTGNLAPADKKLYALRDVTATVESIPLIASSIMSKKIAAGADAIVLDVKCGDGAFMKDIDSARALAKEMVAIGSNVGKKTVAIISDMEQPLGFNIGNSLEVIEAIETLKGRGPADLVKVSLTLATYMLILAGKAKDESEAMQILNDAIGSGRALDILRKMVAAQGGDARAVDDYSILPGAKLSGECKAVESGYVSRIACEETGECCVVLGAGRETKESEIDLGVGIVLSKKVGDRVNAGDVLATLYANDEKRLDEAVKRFECVYHIGPKAPERPVLIKDIIR